jgi:Mycothiol maleylpyruvate isomerase N-terminal domain
METSPDPWIGALRHSHDRLQALVGPLDLAQLEQRSYASEWSIAQVLSHLGSGAEIFGLFLQAGLAGQEPPGRDTFVPIWNAWNAKDPRAQAADGLRSGLPELRLPAEAFVRLVYGRLGPHHTPPVEADGVDLDDLRSIFPGF